MNRVWNISKYDHNLLVGIFKVKVIEFVGCTITELRARCLHLVGGNVYLYVLIYILFFNANKNVGFFFNQML